MKKGCFLTVIISVTIILGTSLYLYRQYKYDAIKYIAEFALDRMNEDLDKHAGKEADSLRTMVVRLPDDLKYDRLSAEQVEDLANMAGKIYEDGTIDSLEINRFSDTLKKNLADYERSKKNKH